MSRVASLLVVLANLMTVSPAGAEEVSPRLGRLFVAEPKPPDASNFDGVAHKSPDFWLGWKGAVVFVSRDAGTSWREAGRFPEHPVRRLVFPGDGRIFAETGTGTLLVSEPEQAGRVWARATEPLDAYDFAMATGLGATATTPFDCLRASLPVRVKVNFGELGCAGGWFNTLYLKLGHEGAELSGWSSTLEGVRVSPRRLSLGEGELLLRELMEAATRRETPPVCALSSVMHLAVLEWACSDSGESHGQVSFLRSLCPSDDPDAGGRKDGVEYARALGLRRVATLALRNLLR
ncbi:hypothetical protein JY651_40405 [Pyxidicoccus parkwayensis]|uniref:Uncharacterized protein n=1 Tax=Pyxidicoccus parkwayensis TaxID=2813578 RepID=A0ABX7NR87_9BACT|nr:hypothetical protein [Pyxidicoccus parkwaysis]QSQ21387.1 hypothetical protein JY651_40405 [Pyxidicoccus parkwaysis]